MGILFVTLIALLFLSLCLVAMLWFKLSCDSGLLSDLAYLSDMIRLGVKLLRCESSRKLGPYTIVEELEQHAKRSPEKVFLIYEGRRYTYREVNATANRVANSARRGGFKCGDKVALMFGNEPSLVWTIIGFAKLGVTCALLNFNLRSKSLVHCIDISEAKTIVVGPGSKQISAMEEILSVLTVRKLRVWRQDATGGFPDMPPSKVVITIDETGDELDLPREVRSGLQFKDPFVLVYTSGTTGMPKASRLSHKKMMAGGHMLRRCDVTNQDVFYITLPLYHVSALFIGLSNAIIAGSTVVLRPKFSASCFWEDCVKYDVTVIFYIGELFRYLLARAPSTEESNNRVRLAVGNGLGADIWETVQNRYKLDRIAETYGATEANFGIMNTDNKVGSVGRWSPLLANLCPIELIEYDYDTAEPHRDENGRCIRVKTGEVGLLVCPISKLFPMEGYVGRKELTEGKMVTDVLRKGDVFFNSGDLLVRDEDHYLYFKDRLGDTFRWKGENVATTEVSQAICELPLVLEANVYGVPVPGNCGKAGMASIICKSGSTFDPKVFHEHIRRRLPNYAWPRFLRFPAILEHTSTLKQTKLKLVEEGFDHSLVSDPIYILDLQAGTYVPLDEDLHHRVTTGDVRL